MKENVWGFDIEEKDIDHHLQETGIDSKLFMFTFGLPLYIYGISVLLSILLPALNLFIRKCCGCANNTQAVELEGGEET
jgi:hypothetical protein